jgi:molybdopterin/thiamine biosynthesis adenylyltransferase
LAVQADERDSGAQALEHTVSATPFPVVETAGEKSVFRYIDTATSRAGISTISAKLEAGRIGIVGLGGTGSYILDLLAKTPVYEIHLFDGDRLLQHNAFRAPGAASIDDLRRAPFKVDYYAGIYSSMRHGVFAHPYFIDASKAAELDGFDFVFLAFDAGTNKEHLIRRLEEAGVPFIDVGMGLYEVDGALSGQLRVVTSTAAHRDRARARIPSADADTANEYAQNIQIADLNALNATLAVIKWKKLRGFYLDWEREDFTAYQLNGSCLINEDVE